MCFAKQIIFVLVMFDGYGNIFSSQTDVTSIQLKLYIQNDSRSSFEINMNNTPDAPIDTACPLEVLLHGWGGSSDADWLISNKNHLLKSGCNNVIVVDWSQLASGEYETAVSNVPRTGEYIGKVLISLADTKEINMKNIRIRAFSLGAQVAGFIGKTVNSETDKKIGRITGMDPAGPSFRNVSSDQRLDKDDAMFTDIIHTGGGKYGLHKAIGHADFYPNGGYYQPCSIFPFFLNICSHTRAHAYFIESIMSDQFVSTPCSSFENFTQHNCNDGEKVSMGYQLNTDAASGKYYLYTNIFRPYARGDN